jgi:hypothetical protein
VGLRPLVCFAKLRYYTTVLSFLIYAPSREKDKSPRLQAVPQDNGSPPISWENSAALPDRSP